MTAFAASTKAYWYLTRSTGVVTLLLLTAIVILGILGPLRVSGSARWPRFTIGQLHRDASLLVLALLVVHIITSVLDRFAPIGLLDAVVPLHSSYRPLWLGFGALAFDLLVALTATSLVRRRLGYAAWRRIHWLAYASFPVAVLHSLGAGSDAKSVWLLWLTVACVAATVLAVIARIIRSDGTPSARAGWVAAAVLTPLGLAVFAVQGPLRSGWASRAGTPATLLRASSSAAATRAPAAALSVSAPPASRIARFSADLSGRLTTSSASGGALIDMAMSLHGASTGQLRVRLAGQPIPGGGLSLVGSQVDLVTPSLSHALAGSVVSLNGRHFVAKVSGPGLVYDLSADLNIDTGTGSVSGRLDAVPATP